MQSLLENFWQEHTQANKKIREEIFGGVCQDILICSCGHKEELALEHMSEIVPIPTVGSIQSGLEQLLIEERIDWNCPKCDSLSVNKKQVIIQEPETLILQLMRYKFDSLKNQVSKIHRQVFCEKRILMPSGTQYILNSIINHIGENTTSGHYNLMMYDEEENSYMLLDDTNVSLLDVYHANSDVSYIFVYEKDLIK